jgi:hypothetical protein
MRHAFKLDQFPSRVGENRRIAVAARWMATFTICWWIVIQIAAGRIIWLW